MSDDLAAQLRDAWASVMRSRRLIVGGAGGMTTEATMRATIREISEWDAELMIDAACRLEALEAENKLLKQLLADAHGRLCEWQRLAHSAADLADLTEECFTAARAALEHKP